MTRNKRKTVIVILIFICLPIITILICIISFISIILIFSKYCNRSEGTKEVTISLENLNDIVIDQATIDKLKLISLLQNQEDVYHERIEEGIKLGESSVIRATSILDNEDANILFSDSIKISKNNQLQINESNGKVDYDCYYKDKSCNIKLLEEIAPPDGLCTPMGYSNSIRISFDNNIIISYHISFGENYDSIFKELSDFIKSLKEKNYCEIAEDFDLEGINDDNEFRIDNINIERNPQGMESSLDLFVTINGYSKVKKILRADVYLNGDTYIGGSTFIIYNIPCEDYLYEFSSTFMVFEFIDKVPLKNNNEIYAKVVIRELSSDDINLIIQKDSVRESEYKEITEEVYKSEDILVYEADK